MSHVTGRPDSGMSRLPPEVAVALNLMRFKGAQFVDELALRIGSPERLLAGDKKELAELGNMGPLRAERILRARQGLNVASHLKSLERKGIRVLTPGSPGYPELLAQSPCPPLALYCLGRFDPSALPIAVVGTRASSGYGLEMAQKLGRELSDAGALVVSGLARGVDGSAHTGALAGQARTTVAVLGNGVDICYPPEHRALYERIRSQGALVSELPPGYRPLPRNFPARNRIIAGLCRGVVVVEAPRQSGALITADLAADAGRDVFAVPGLATSTRSQGTLKLLKEGAKLTTCAEDILGEYCHSVLPLMEDSGGPGTATGDATRLSRAQRTLLDLMDEQGLSVDQLVERTYLGVPEVFLLLEDLEGMGLVKRLPGNRYRRSGGYRLPRPAESSAVAVGDDR